MEHINGNKERTESVMTAFIKDFLAFVSLSAFSITALTWLDIISSFA
jgi:hypothetical protein